MDDARFPDGHSESLSNADREEAVRWAADALARQAEEVTLRREAGEGREQAADYVHVEGTPPNPPTTLTVGGTGTSFTIASGATNGIPIICLSPPTSASDQGRVLLVRAADALATLYHGQPHHQGCELCALNVELLSYLAASEGAREPGCLCGAEAGFDQPCPVHAEGAREKPASGLLGEPLREQTQQAPIASGVEADPTPASGNPQREMLRAVIHEAQQRYSWDDADLDGWLRAVLLYGAAPLPLRRGPSEEAIDWLAAKLWFSGHAEEAARHALFAAKVERAVTDIELRRTLEYFRGQAQLIADRLFPPSLSSHE